MELTQRQRKKFILTIRNVLIFLKRSIYILGAIIILPLIINLVTNFVSWNDIWNNGWIILFTISLLVNIIFIISIYFETLAVNNNDIVCYNRLMKIINSDDTKYILHEMINNLPVSQDNTLMFRKFIRECENENNQLINKKLHALLNDFKDSLSNYIDKRANYTFPLKNDIGYFGFDSEFKREFPELYTEYVKELDELASIAYRKLRILIQYAKSKNIHNIEYSLS